MSFEEQMTVPIGIPELLARAGQMRTEGYRLVQIGCAKIGDTYEINYSFDKDRKFLNLRITVAPGTEIPSISGIYWGAFVYENEIFDLYGITVTGINIDFKGTFYRTAVKHAFSVTTGKEDNPCLNK
ncbi:MAG TPA: NADH-quinone oxidoreductase subunit C [Methanoregula sp.]|nr:NADH-quinone oxidoreductase subunit C [Methanoregula sp.]